MLLIVSHPVVGAGLETLLRLEDRFQVKRVLRLTDTPPLLAEWQPDVVLLDGVLLQDGERPRLGIPTVVLSGGAVDGEGLVLALEGDARGWLHLFDADVLLDMATKRECPAEIFHRRPLLELVFQQDRRLRAALAAEMYFWHELDRSRMQIYEQAVRTYRSAVMHEHSRDETDLRIQHEVRVRCAEQHLPLNPLQDYGFERMVADAHAGVRELSGGSDAWLLVLPDVRENFEELFP